MDEMTEKERQGVLEFAKDRGIETWDCCDFLKSYETDERSALTQVFARGKWAGLSVREGISVAKAFLDIHKEEYMEGIRDAFGSDSDSVRFAEEVYDFCKSIRPLDDDQYPAFFHNEDGNSLEVWTRPYKASVLGKWLGHSVTMLCDIDTGVPFGFELTGISKMSGEAKDEALKCVSENGLELTEEVLSQVDDWHEKLSQNAS